MTNWKLLLLIILVVLVFVGVAGYGDFRDTFGSLSQFPISYLLGALGLAALNFALRYLRWSFYLRVLRDLIGQRKEKLEIPDGSALVARWRIGPMERPPARHERRAREVAKRRDLALERHIRHSGYHDQRPFRRPTMR